MMRSLALSLGSAVVLGGCFSVVTSAAGPTALERQLLGAYDDLDRELVLAASVRGEAAFALGSPEALKAAAVEGRALMRFNEDDLAELKAQGCVAETLRAEITEWSCAGANEELSRRRARVIRDENQARRAVLAWAAYLRARELGREAPTAAEIEELLAAYRRLLFETAQPGQLFERTPGKFEPISRGS